jgi:hypothetical protein
MCDKKITTIQGLITHIKNNSSWSAATIRNVITALGHNPNGGRESLVELSGILADCVKHGADGGFPGFTYYRETLQFFRQNRGDIVNNIARAAAETGEDVIKMVQNFGVFRYSPPPGSGEVSRPLWASARLHDDLTTLYNVFARYALEEVSHIWYRYLEDNPRPIHAPEPVRALSE